MHGGVRLHVVAARDRQRAEAFAEEHGFDHVADRYDEVIADPAVDLVYNPLPINLHAEWSIRALEAGKHVLCEKPLAMNLDEAEAAVAAADASGKRLIEAFHYRYHPLFETYLRWLRDGRIGALQRIEAAFNAPIDDAGGTEIRHRPETGGGAFMDLGCYPLSWTLMSTPQDPVTIDASATLTKRGVDESMTVTLVFGDGLEARLVSSMAMDQQREMWLKVVGDAGEIRFDNPLAPQIGSRLSLRRGGEQTTAPYDRVTTYFYQLDTVVRALQSGQPLPTEGAAILRQQRLIDAVYDAAGLGSLRRR